jgi:RNA polymerase sigma-70 factor (family 1)
MLKRLFYKKIFDRIFSEQYTRLYMYAYHLIDDGEASRDILGDVFIKFWEDIEHIDLNNIPGYLTVIVRNKCTDYLRHQMIEIQYTKEYLSQADEMYTDYSELKKLDVIVNTMLDKLPPFTRHILDECYLNGKTYNQVAEELNISPSTVKKHISKSLKILKDIFGGEKSLEDMPEFDNESFII